jgi:hypothetical protein
LSRGFREPGCGEADGEIPPTRTSNAGIASGAQKMINGDLAGLQNGDSTSGLLFVANKPFCHARA